MMQKIAFTKAFVEGQWRERAVVEIDDDGIICAIDFDNNITAHGAQMVEGYALPAMPNIHSHAFQRAMAGLAEYTMPGGDNFWSWRDIMYRFAQHITPDDLYDIARQLYLEMVMAGYGSVAEFHYLHHRPGGGRYDDPAEMSLAIIRAAADVGIALTHLPVLYMASGFSGQPLSEEQSRFGHDVDEYCALLDRLHGELSNQQTQKLGVAFHSLRAVPPEAISDVLSYIVKLDKDMPIHIHIAEQAKEVEDCITWSGQRPVEWLLDHHDVDERWCLIHATHLNDGETSRLAKSGAVAGLCPTTEANLGDGLFPLGQYLDQGGRIAIGSDSNISVSPVEELRLLEYGQRLQYQNRNIAASREQPHTGTALYLDAVEGGALASGFGGSAIAVGRQANFTILDPASPLLVETPDRFLLDRFLFNGNQSCVKDMMIAGKWIIANKMHAKAEEITKDFRATMKRLAVLID